MHIDTSSIADRINQLRPNITARSQSFNQGAINNDQIKSRTDASEDIAAKRRLQFAPPAQAPITIASNLGKQVSIVSTPASDQKSSVGKYESEPGNPINSLLADWGKTDSNYDLNSDGTVNTQDLLMLLNKLSNSANSDDRPTALGKSDNTPVHPITSDSPSGKPTNRIDALLADWGKADSNYDFNADGTVNTQDLLMLFEKLAASDNSSDPALVNNNPDITASQPDKPDNRIDALMADWGKTDSNYDLNADGTVNTKDLLMLLAKLSASQSSDNPTLKTNPDSNISEPDKPYTGIDELMADWGKSDSKFDLNADGTVNTKDLLMLLAGLNQSINKMGTANPILGPSLASLAISPQLGHSNSHTSVNHAYHKVSTDQATNQLSHRMTNNREAELRKFLTSTDFTNAEKKAILSEFHYLNMGSVGFNAVG